MTKIIKSDLVIGNALIEYDKEEISLNELVKFDNILSNIISEYNYYTKGITRNYIIEFCDNYAFIATFDYENDSIIVYPNKQLMYRYFRIGIPNYLVDSFKNVIEIMNSIVLKKIKRY